MEWNKYTIVTAEEAEEIVCALLGELEIYSVEIEDKKPVSPDESGGLFGDVVPELPEDDHIARISFYLDADEDPEPYLARLRAGLKELSETMGTGESRILASKTAEEDWIMAVKKVPTSSPSSLFLVNALRISLSLLPATRSMPRLIRFMP